MKLTGYVVDVKCAAEHAKGKPEDIMKFAAEHTKECALMEACVRSGYGIFSDGHWFPFDAKGNELAKALIEKTQKKDHIKVTVEGTKHEGKRGFQEIGVNGHNARNNFRGKEPLWLSRKKSSMNF